MKKSYVWLTIGLLLLSFLGITLLQMFHSDFWPYTLRTPSPNGEYCLEQRYTDFGTVGYRGKTFLIHGKQRWFIDDVGPGHADWLSDTEFYIGQRFTDWYEEHSVFDYIGEDQPSM